MSVLFEQAKKISAITEVSQTTQAMLDCVNLRKEGKIEESDLEDLLQMVQDVTVRLTTQATQAECDKPSWERGRFVSPGQPWENSRGAGTTWKFGGNGRKERVQGVTSILDVLYASGMLMQAWHSTQDSQVSAKTKERYDVRDELKDVRWAELANELYKAANTITDALGIDTE